MASPFREAAALIHCRRADHARQSARRRRCAETHHCRDEAGCANCPGRDRPAEIPVGAISACRVRPFLGEAGARHRAARTGARDAGNRPGGAAGNGIAGHHRSRRDRGRSAEAGAVRKISDEVTETLDYVPGRFKVVRHLREKLSCRVCDMVVAAPAPDHVIVRGRAGAGLLAHIVVSKYDDHLPLYRQAEIFARDGVSLETSTLSGWVGATAVALQPLVDALAGEVIASEALHVDDTPVPVLAPGKERPTPDGCGPISAMSGHSLAPGRRLPCSSIRLTAKASIRGPT